MPKLSCSEKSQEKHFRKTLRKTPFRKVVELLLKKLTKTLFDFTKTSCLRKVFQWEFRSIFIEQFSLVINYFCEETQSYLFDRVPNFSLVSLQRILSNCVFNLINGVAPQLLADELFDNKVLLLHIIDSIWFFMFLNQNQIQLTDIKFDKFSSASSKVINDASYQAKRKT